MFIPDSYTVALLLMILCMTSWGSFANAFKLAKGVRFELLYWDYAAGVFVMAFLIAITLGCWHGGETSFFNNLSSATGPRIGLAMLGGTIFNLANILLIAAIAIAGLSVAFPVGIGTALVVGTILTYIVDPKGDVTLLSLGVVLAIIAIVADALAYRELSSGKVKVTKKGLWVSIIAGLLMGTWSPLYAASTSPGDGYLTPYTGLVFFTLATFLSTFFFNIYFMVKPLSGEPVSFEGYLQGKPSWHVLGLLAGMIWTIGMASYGIAGSKTGAAVSYALGQSAPMVAALWGVFAWQEFAGASVKSRMYLLFMFIFYLGAIAAIACAAPPIETA